MTEETLTIYLDSFSKLDEEFRKIASGSYQLQVGERPTRYQRGDVLLASTAHTTDGAFDQVYLIVGILRDCAISDDRSTLTFGKWERFPVPIVVSSESSEARRADLLGSSFQGFFPKVCYLAPGAAEAALEEARAALEARIVPVD